MAKHYTKSRTIKFNALVIVAATAVLPIVEQNQDLLKAQLSPLGFLLVLIGVSLVNVWLRTVTRAGITRK